MDPDTTSSSGHALPVPRRILQSPQTCRATKAGEGLVLLKGQANSHTSCSRGFQSWCTSCSLTLKIPSDWTCQHRGSREDGPEKTFLFLPSRSDSINYFSTHNTPQKSLLSLSMIITFPAFSTSSNKLLITHLELQAHVHLCVQEEKPSLVE